MNASIKTLAMALGMMTIGGMALAETAATNSTVTTEYEAVYRNGLQTMYALQGLSQEKIDAKVEAKTQAEMKRFASLTPVAQTNKLAFARKLQSKVSSEAEDVQQLNQKVQKLKNLKRQFEDNKQLKESINSAASSAAAAAIGSLLQ